MIHSIPNLESFCKYYAVRNIPQEIKLCKCKPLSNPNGGVYWGTVLCIVTSWECTVLHGQVTDSILPPTEGHWYRKKRAAHKKRNNLFLWRKMMKIKVNIMLNIWKTKKETNLLYVNMGSVQVIICMPVLLI